MRKKWQVIVIGGGPAGLMAAGQAAAAGAQTLLLEKMDRPGRKLRITGKGRCNLTNIASLDEFMRHFHPHGRFLQHAFHRFFTQDLLDFLNSLGIETTIERGGRVFPSSNDAQQVVDALVGWAKDQGVTIRTNRRVSDIKRADANWELSVEPLRPRSLKLSTEGDEKEESFSGEAVILATGGTSYPGTGSTGDGYRFAASLGHLITSIRPALVPLITAGDIAGRLQGLSLRNVRCTLLADGQPQAREFGEMLFTQHGLSGPIILALSRRAVDALSAGARVSVSIDLKPALEHPVLDARLRREFDAHGKRLFKTILADLLPRSLIPLCVELTHIPAEKPGHQVNAAERKRLRLWLKDFHLDVIGHAPIAQAIVTAGGVDLKQVDPRSLQSRLQPGLFFAGELLDLDADTGGFNLQAAFSTGWLAGRSAASM
jgi:predicted Rossmann fold flavoprotein